MGVCSIHLMGLLGFLLPCFIDALLAQDHLVAAIIPGRVKDATTSAPVAMPRYNRFADHFKVHMPSLFDYPALIAGMFSSTEAV
jgi:hypothetical protein